MKRRELLGRFGAAVVGGVLVHDVFGAGGAANAAPSQAFIPDVDLTLRAGAGEVSIHPGTPTRVWQFTGRVHQGPPESLSTIPNSFLGPTIRVRRGQRVRIRFENRLPEPSIVHWHGLDVPSAMDGHPHRVVGSGADYVYEFEVTNRAGTYWYHPHPHERTGAQVNAGLAGLFIVTDDEERAARLPDGAAEIPLVLQDRRFDAANQFAYVRNMMDSRLGFLGNRVLVNGAEPATLSVATRAYRFRVLNGSSARIYKLAWSDGTPITVIGGDGGLLERAIERPFVTLAPAQRVDIILDLSSRATGAQIELRSDTFPAGEVSIDEGMMMGGMRGDQSANGAAFRLVTLRIDRRESVPFSMPARLSTFAAAWAPNPSAAVRRVALTFQRGQWFLAGRTFDMTTTEADEVVRAGSTQVWEFDNVGGMMQMAHPMHMHGRQFRVLGRTRAAGAETPSLLAGVVDDGWTDTVLVFPGEKVRVQVQFTTHPGLYLYHCHILEHEDMGMMRNFRVTPP